MEAEKTCKECGKTKPARFFRKSKTKGWKTDPKHNQFEESDTCSDCRQEKHNKTPVKSWVNSVMSDLTPRDF